MEQQLSVESRALFRKYKAFWVDGGAGTRAGRFVYQVPRRLTAREGFGNRDRKPCAVFTAVYLQ